jgi:hypothetical protein
MEYYFRLQFKRLQRTISDFGIQPFIGFFLSLLVFLVSSFTIFSQVAYSEYIYASLAILSVLKLGEENRINFLKSLFTVSDFYKVRLIENTLITIPFAGFLTFEGFYMLTIAVLIGSVVLSASSFNQRIHLVIPTPYKRMPFEFTIGFRKTYWALLLLGFIMYKAIEVGNFNLGLFSLGAITLISLSFFLIPENPFFVWVYAYSSKVFLVKKIKLGITGYLIFTTPFALVLAWVFTSDWIFVLGLELIGIVFLIAVILAKYSRFPKEISLPQVVFLGICLWFPPLVLLVIPYFYSNANKKLKEVLG